MFSFSSFYTDLNKQMPLQPFYESYEDRLTTFDGIKTDNKDVCDDEIFSFTEKGFCYTKLNLPLVTSPKDLKSILSCYYCGSAACIPIKSREEKEELLQNHFAGCKFADGITDWTVAVVKNKQVL